MHQHGSNILLIDPLPGPWGGVKSQLFLNMDMLYIKLKGMTNAVTWGGVKMFFMAPTSKKS